MRPGCSMCWPVPWWGTRTWRRRPRAPSQGRSPRRQGDCAAAVRAVGVLLESLGHRVEESHPEALDDPAIGGHVARVVAAWTARDLDVWGQRTGAPIAANDVEP